MKLSSMEPLKANLLLISKEVEIFKCFCAVVITFEKFCSTSVNSLVQQVNKLRSILSLALLYIVKEDTFVPDLANFQDIFCMYTVEHLAPSERYLIHVYQIFMLQFCNFLSHNYFCCLTFKMFPSLQKNSKSGSFCKYFPKGLFMKKS